MGARVDNSAGLLRYQANGDDATGLLSDDDGVVDPWTSLSLVEGTQPSVTVTVLNVTGQSATLAGWIDYNRDGIFVN